MLFPDRLRLPLDFDPALLARDLDLAARDGWIAHFLRENYEGAWDIIPLRAPEGARRPAAMVLVDPRTERFADTPALERCAYFRDVLRQFRCPLRMVRLMRLAPGSIIKEHRDDFLGIEEGWVRLHVPVVTNDAVDFRLGGRRVVLAPGTCWYLDFGEPHSIANRGETDRVHLVIDAELDAWLVGLLAEAERNQVLS